MKRYECTLRLIPARVRSRVMMLMDAAICWLEGHRLQRCGGCGDVIWPGDEDEGWPRLAGSDDPVWLCRDCWEDLASRPAEPDEQP